MKNLRFLLFVSFSCFSQKTIPDVLKQFNNNSVPYITISELKVKKNMILFDAREEAEFNTSHIKNAQFVGCNKFNSKNIKQNFPNFEATIVVYCSLGVRSEKIGEKLLKMGYKNVFNLYGGIFEWKNQNLPVYDANDQETENVHAFSKEWSSYLLKGKKVF
jgi:rhodanese-related sulfurtransferase